MFQAVRPRRRAIEQRCWPTMRVKRAKLKSRRDDMIIAQGKRGTSAALGHARNIYPSPFSWCTAPGYSPARYTRKKGRLGVGCPLPRAAASAALPWTIIMLPLWGAGWASQGAAARCWRLARQQPGIVHRLTLTLGYSHAAPLGRWRGESGSSGPVVSLSSAATWHCTPPDHLTLPFVYVMMPGE